jgi:peptide/nickel transport system substrate-binding protein
MHLAEKAVIAMVVTAMASTLAACSSGSTPTTSPLASKNTTLTIGAPSGPNGLDPYNCGEGPEGNILRSGYDTLIRSAPNGTFQPSLALSWGYTSPTSFSMKLRSGVSFSDGTPMNAAAVVANLERASRTAGQITAAFAQAVQSVAAVDPTDVTITLSTPNPDLTTILSSCAGMIVSPELLAQPSQMTNTMDGTGPYNYNASASTPGSIYTFKRKATYWNSAAYPFHTVVFKVITDFNTEFNAIRSGELDFAVGTPGEVSSATAAGLASVQGSVNFYAVDLRDREGTKVPALKSVLVRQALNYAIDRAAIIKTFFGSTGRPTDQLLNIHAAGYDAALNDSYPYDPTKAKQLLAEAGYPNGFTLPVLSTQGFELDQVLQAVSGYWAKIGVKVQDDVQQIGNWEVYLISNEYPSAIFPFSGLPPYTALAQSFGPDGPLDPFHSANAAIDSALSLASAAANPSAMAPSITSAQKTLINQAWYAGIGYDAVIWFYNPKVVTGIQMQQGESVPHFYDWKVPS